MKCWNARWAKYAILSVVIIAGAAAISEAHYYFRFWWFRPPVPAIEDVDFNDGTMRFASARTIKITSGVGITQNNRASLTPVTDPDFVAAVSDEGSLITLAGLDPAAPDPTIIDPTLPILLSSTTSSAGAGGNVITTTTNVEIIMDPAQLHGSFFSSRFRGAGVAIVTVNVLEEDDTGAEVSNETTATSTDVRVYGTVHQSAATGLYYLRGSIRGFNREQVGNDLCYTFLSAYFNAETPIPVPAP